MKSKKVLIVDDNELNRKLFENLVGQLYDFKSAHNGMEAIEMATATPFDLILMDIQMPVLDGYGATTKLREWEAKTGCPPRPIIALTAGAFAEDRASCLEAGMDDYLSKPFKIGELAETLSNWLHKDR